MDDATYDEPHMNETPFNDDERYRNLKSTQRKNPSYGIQGTTHNNQTDGDKKIYSKHNLKYLMALIVVIVILFVLVVASIALSVATYSLLSSEMSKIVGKIDKVAAIISAHEILQSQTQCGPGLWYQLMHTNMCDPSQQCPFVWREYNNSGVRACGRPVSTSGSCAAIVTQTYIRYSRVCGRVIGFQYASPDAFRRFGPSNINFDGINITYGVQHNHIWSYVAGSLSDSSHPGSKCPCAGGGIDTARFRRDNYYCESGNTDAYTLKELYSNDPLWDGQQCEGTCCNGTNSPPWFSVQLPTPTTDGVEVSICCDEGTDNEDVPVQLIEIYVQ